MAGMTLQTPTGNDLGSQQQDFEDKLRSRGFSEAEIQAFRGGFVPKSDFTRVRQEDSRRLRELESHMLRLQQAVQQQSSGPEARGSDLEQFLMQKGMTRDRFPEVFDLLSGLSEFQEQRLLNRMQHVVAPIVVGQQQNQLRSQRQTLEARYGSGISEYWPDIEQRCNEIIQQGYVPDPNIVFQNLFPDKADDLLYRRVHAERTKQGQRAASQSMEGLNTVERTAAMGGMGQEKETVGEPLSNLDLTQFAAEVFSEIERVKE